VDNRDRGSFFSKKGMAYLSLKYVRLILIFFAAALISGCQKPGPIDLNPQVIDSPVVLPSAQSSDLLWSTDDIDSAKLLPPLEMNGLGQLLIEGSEFDSRTEHHEVAIARAIFFNKEHPVIVNTDTAYSTLNIGSVKIDLLSLGQIPRRYTTSSGTADTVLGIQYALFNQDGFGGAGFSFEGNRQYHWIGAGRGVVSAFDVATTTPAKIHVVSPDVRTIVRASSDLTVRWTGGGDTVRIYVREIENGNPGKVWLRLVQKGNNGRVTIPKTLLRLLPVDQSEFMFTFTSSQTSRLNLSGFAGDVIVQNVTSHNLVLQVKP
jgi:hypothetical protein